METGTEVLSHVARLSILDSALAIYTVWKGMKSSHSGLDFRSIERVVGFV